jgi:anti-sigma regulatory factor (Ser/Thr protein kinase)
MSPRLRELSGGFAPLDATARETTSPEVGFESVSTVFASVPPSAGSARRFVGAALRRWDVSDAVIEVALLLTSELVTNTYRHADSDARVSVLRRPGLVRVEVHDSGEGGVQRRPLDPEQPDGRGLNIVETLAQGWGCMSSEGGTLVWFELSVADR